MGKYIRIRKGIVTKTDYIPKKFEKGEVIIRPSTNEFTESGIYWNQITNEDEG